MRYWQRADRKCWRIRKQNRERQRPVFSASLMQAYLITFRCYGTWVHGDERGAVNHRQNNFGTPLLEPHCGLEQAEKLSMKHSTILLDSPLRKVIDRTIREVITYRGWELFALAVRTNHVHIVVGTDGKPEKAMNDFKAWSTRRLREASLILHDTRLWAQHGSTRYLWNDEEIAAACRYVAEGQGVDI